MENKAAVQSNYANANGNMLATSAGAGCVSPNLPATEISTCQPSVCGGATCYSTCSGQNTCFNTCGLTCSNTCANTCASTCQSTCSQNTCAGTCENTCVPGACQHYDFAGTCYWVYGSSDGNNWSHSPMPCVNNSAGSVLNWFDDEPSPANGGGTPISGVNYSNGSFSGTRTRTTTSYGAYLQQVAILWYPDGQYVVAGQAGYVPGPLTPNHIYSGYLDLYE